MRFLSGVIVGAILMVGAAYWHDASIEPEREPATRTLVNWDVAAGVFKNTGEWLRGQVDWIGQQLHH